MEIHQLEADSIFLEFGSRKVLSDVYIKCETGKITALLGRNGNGKSCLMNIIYGNLMPNSKSVRFDGQVELAAYKRPDLLLYLPQFNFIPSQLTLKRIFSDFKLEFSDFEIYFPQFLFRQNIKFSNLSGGERRITELYIIIKSKTQFVILDEPFSHLSPIQIDEIKVLILKEKSNKGFLITDHMYRHVLDISDNVYVLTNGKTHHTKDITEIEFLGYAKFS
jgi:ABC-type lipopolysaccharide export system ATPase subunit